MAYSKKLPRHGVAGMLVIPAVRRLREEDRGKFKASLNLTARGWGEETNVKGSNQKIRRTLCAIYFALAKSLTPVQI